MTSKPPSDTDLLPTNPMLTGIFRYTSKEIAKICPKSKEVAVCAKRYGLQICLNNIKQPQGKTYVPNSDLAKTIILGSWTKQKQICISKEAAESWKNFSSNWCYIIRLIYHSSEVSQVRCEICLQKIPACFRIPSSVLKYNSMLGF